MDELPHYFSSLESFRELFATGRPLLTYHHVGARPQGTRLKGLYISRTRFTKQMRELASNNFSAPGYDGVTSELAARNREVLLTFDDGFADALENAVPVLKRHGFSGIQFLVADLLGKTSEWQVSSGEIAGQLMDVAQVKDWLAAGNEIGSHTLTHPYLTRIPLPEAREELAGSRKKLEDLFGRTVEHFCYPYGDWSPAILELVQEAGYKTACTTDFGVNDNTANPLLLKRITARYPSRNLKNLIKMLKA
ncbi:MAG TPA: polysaccharide deacetylase family protein [Candidatus Dormibacteraeota bacterium]|nr:polysaccharide deacetylase family protein [Candidatus Dormibacteraeota bacterium]